MNKTASQLYALLLCAIENPTESLCDNLKHLRDYGMLKPVDGVAGRLQLTERGEKWLEMILATPKPQMCGESRAIPKPDCREFATPNTQPLTLLSFCAASYDLRYYLHRPFNHANHTWASAGWWIAKAPLDPQYDSNPQLNERCLEYLANLKQDVYIYSQRLDEIELPPHQPCAGCQGAGTTESSPELTEQCWQCLGAGAIETNCNHIMGKGITIGPGIFNFPLIYQLRKLPNAAIHVPEERIKPALITSDAGFDVYLMPRKE